MAKNSRYLKLHLLEIHVLRRILNEVDIWIQEYHKQQESEILYSSIISTCEDKKTKRYYVNKLKYTRKQLGLLGKRINFDSLTNLFQSIFKRLDILYKLDIEKQKESNFEPEKQKVSWKK